MSRLPARSRGDRTPSTAPASDLPSCSPRRQARNHDHVTVLRALLVVAALQTVALLIAGATRPLQLALDTAATTARTPAGSAATPASPDTATPRTNSVT